MTTNHDALREALKRIEAWDECSPKFRMNYGSNGERDYYRKIASEAIAVSKPEPHDDGVPSWVDARLNEGYKKPEPQAQAEPCPNSTSDEFACKNRHQCWEPCGELGNSAAHARPVPKETQDAVNAALGLPQAQAGENINGYLHLKPPFEDENGEDISGEYITLQSHREAMAAVLVEMASVSAKALAKKDAALKACVEALKSHVANDKQEAAITQAHEAMK